MTERFELILFDLGGVLVELRSNPFPEAWLPGGKTFDCIDWLKSDTALQFECGHLSPEAFAEGVKKELNLDASTDEILAHFSRWPIGLYAGAQQLLLQLLLQLKDSCQLAALSNTNAVHWPRLIHEFELHRYFSHIFASHRIACAKPDPKAFHHVINALDVTPEKILFFDDNLVNVAAARQLGINSRQASSVEQVREHLRKFGLPQGSVSRRSE